MLTSKFCLCPQTPVTLRYKISISPLPLHAHQVSVSQAIVIHYPPQYNTNSYKVRAANKHNICRQLIYCVQVQTPPTIF